MRYPASEKLEIIRMVEQSHLPAKRTLDRPGIPRRTFYRWYDRYIGGGPEALQDPPSAPSRVWNRIPPAADVRFLGIREFLPNGTNGRVVVGAISPFACHSTPSYDDL